MSPLDIENDLEPDVKPDHSVFTFLILMGSIVLIMGLLLLFMEDIRKLFNPPPPPPAPVIQTTTPHRVEQTPEMSDEEIKTSLTKFIEAFYVDQKKGYFDPPSYFAPITQTYYNYHNLTYQGLKQAHLARMADLQNLELTWLVHTLSFESRNDTMVVNYWTRQQFFKPSDDAQVSADVLMEIKLNKEGKIASIREVEVRNRISQTREYQPEPATPHNNTKTANKPTDNKSGFATENTVYNSANLTTPPEFRGGNRKLQKYLTKNLRYPQNAQERHVEGKVYIGFIVEANGNLAQLKVIRGIGYGCDEEALRVLSNSPAWKPGELNGKAVRSSYVLPIVFQLSE